MRSKFEAIERFSTHAGKLGERMPWPSAPESSPTTPSSASSLTRVDSLAAPKEDGGVLCEPALARVPRLIEETRESHRVINACVLGRSLADLRRQARLDLVASALDYTRQYQDVEERGSDTILLSGHQPELFHPGVWFKNFCLSHLATRHDATSINLVIDGDVPKSTSVLVPGGTPRSPQVAAIPFDAPGAGAPYEDRSILDRAVLESFGARSLDRLKSLSPRPLLVEYWPLVVAQSRETSNLGACLARSRHLLERDQGWRTLELPWSRVCESAGFQWFALDLLNRAGFVRETYNRAIDEYRQANRIRGKNHPAPRLESVEDWVESPLWLWTKGAPVRRRVFVRTRATEIEVGDRREIRFTIPRGDGSAGERAWEVLSELPHKGVRFRSRALLTTLYARVVLADLFVHGIGGGKYDRITNGLIERWFGIRPPPFLVASATCRLNVDRPRNVSDDRRRVAAMLRDLTFHPERHVNSEGRDSNGGRPAGPGTIEELVETKHRWIENSVPTEGAKRRCHEIRRVNELLQPWVEAKRRRGIAEERELAELTRVAEILGSREYAFCLHSAKIFEAFIAGVRTA